MTAIDLSTWREDSETFEFDGHTLFVKDSQYQHEADDKPVLLLIHGFPTASIDWQPIWPELCRHFRCITLDLLGFGLSSKPKNQPITIVQQGAICRALLVSKSIAKAHILSHDYGVSVAQELLAGTQEMNSFTPLSCIFLNGGLFPGVHRPRLIQKLLMSPIGHLVAKLTSYKRFAKTMRDICTQPLHEQELELYWQLLTRNGGRTILPALIRYMAERKVHGARWGAITDKPPCPTMLINGVDDPISGGHLAEAYSRRVENPKIERLSETGHYPQVEAPDKVLVAAKQFWSVNNIQLQS